MTCEFNESDLTYVKIKMSRSMHRSLTVSEFFATADLKQPCLYEYNNSCVPVEDDEALVMSGVRVIVNSITKQYMSIGAEDHEANTKLLNLCRTLGCLDHLDTILRKMWLRGDYEDEKALIQEILANYDKGAKQTISLVPNIIIGRYPDCSYSLVEYGKLLEICQASERFFRKQMQDANIQLQREIFRLEGKTPQ